MLSETQAPGRSPRWIQFHLPLLIVATGAASVAWFLNTRVIDVGRSLEWDESLHALLARRMADALTSGNIIGFLYDSYRSVMWPPVHAWYLGAVLAIVPSSTAVARASSLIPLVGSAVLVFLAARELPERRRGAPVAAIAAAACLLSSKGVLALSTHIMAESLANAGLAASIWLYFRTLRRGEHDTEGSPRGGYALLGAAVFVTYLTKYNHGVLLALTVAGCFLIDGGWLSRPRFGLPLETARRRGQLICAAVLGLLLLIWFAYPPKVSHTLTWLGNTPYGPDRFSRAGLMYYPASLVWLAGSPVLLALWILALAVSLRPGLLRSAGPVRFLVLFIVIQMAFAELAVNKRQRLLLPLAPVWALLVGYWIERFWIRISKASRLPARASLAGLLAAIACSAALVITHNVRALSAEEGGPAKEEALFQWMAAALERDGPAIVLSSAKIFPYPGAIDWDLVVRGRMSITGAGSIGPNLAEQQFAAHWAARLPPALRSSLLNPRDRYPGRSGTYTGYVGAPSGLQDKLTAANYHGWIGELLEVHPVDRALVLVDQAPEPTEPSASLVVSELGLLGFHLDPEAGRRFESRRLQVLVFNRQN